MWQVVPLKHLVSHRWRHKHQCRERLVSSATHHQPVNPSRRKNVHPGQICKHQFNLHGESCCHQLWQQKASGPHQCAKRHSSFPQYLCQKLTLSHYGRQKLPLRGSFPLCQSQRQNGFCRVTVEMMWMPCGSFFTLIVDKLLLAFGISIRTFSFNHHKIIHLS